MAMTVKDLREALDGLPDDMIVVCRSGDGFSPLSSASADNNSYIAEETWYGDVRLACLGASEEAQGFTEEDVGVGGVPCLALRPVN